MRLLFMSQIYPCFYYKSKYCIYMYVYDLLSIYMYYTNTSVHLQVNSFDTDYCYMQFYVPVHYVFSYLVSVYLKMMKIKKL